MKNNQKEVINAIMELLEVSLLFEETPTVKNELDALFKQDIDLNRALETRIPTLLFQAIYHASWDLFNYFVLKGADVHYRTDYNSNKNINCIEFAEILLQEIKTTEIPLINDELKDVDRLEDSFDKGQSESEITMQEFYAFKLQGDILKQVIFIEEFLRKFPPPT